MQVADFIGFIGLARRTGRFPQLVDPRSCVNGLFLTGSPRFREFQSEDRRSLCRLKQSAPAPHSPRHVGGLLHAGREESTARRRATWASSRVGDLHLEASARSPTERLYWTRSCSSFSRSTAKDQLFLSQNSTAILPKCILDFWCRNASASASRGNTRSMTGRNGSAFIARTISIC